MAPVSTESVSKVQSIPSSKHNHPLDPPTAEEITATTSALRKHLLEVKDIHAFKFTTVFLKEPPKASVIAELKWPGGSADSTPTGPVLRQVEVHVIDLIKGTAYEAIVQLDSLEDVQIKSFKALPGDAQPGLTIEELIDASLLVREDERVVKFAKDVGVEKEQIYADGWSIGWDTRFPGKRLQQCLLYARYSKDENLYAHPLDFFPIIDCNSGKVLAIDFPPHRVGKDGALTAESTAEPKTASFDDVKDRSRILPPTQSFDYLPELVKGPDGKSPLEMRTDIKPLSVIQPEGVGFKRDGNVLEWGKFKLHVGFHPREGIVLSTISYKDDDLPGASKANPTERPLFYRMSLAEMVVPYAETAYPHYKKFAFDVGEYGLGYLSNSLSLGCDCLGSIEYMDGIFSKHDGSIETVKNAICIHEEDAGLAWKHTDYRTGGRAHAVRGRKLVISMICTVANYEYCIYWNFHTDGNIELEIKLTGILNLYVLGEGEKPSGFGTEVAPRINAHYHQHLFSVRVDPHIDGPLNSVQEQRIEAHPDPTGSKDNWAGNGFTAKYTTFATAGESVRDANAAEERAWTFINENKKHYASGKPAGYKVMCKDMPPLWAKKDSFIAVRAPFAKHNLWTVPYSDDHKYPAGMYVPQTQVSPEDSIEKWVGDGKAEIANKDIVSYLTFGTSHVPRPEDFPVMPAETVRMMFKPVNFFTRNPILDIPSVKDAKSVAAKAAVNGSANGCCA